MSISIAAIAAVSSSRKRAIRSVRCAATRRQNPMRVEFFVPGIPKPGGSKIAQPVRRKGGAIVTYKDKRGNDTPLITVRDASKNQDWKNAVAYAGHRAMDGKELMSGPIAVVVLFLMPRIKGHFKPNGDLRKSAPEFHTVKPDLTKLMRSTEDALTGIVWRDDSTIVEHRLSKRYGEICGATIMVMELEAGVG
jgi:Holliday junction resolvase RusA-like endonuclease